MEYVEDNLFDLLFETQEDRVENALIELTKATTKIPTSFKIGKSKVKAIKEIIKIFKSPNNNNKTNRSEEKTPLQ